MIKYVAFILLILSAASCMKDEIVPFMPAGCMIDDQYEDRSDLPCTEHLASCTPTEVPGKFHFVENARKYLPQSCLEIGDKIYYTNPDGDHVGFEIISKDHALVRSSYLILPPCANMPDYCFRSEVYKLQMK